MSTSGLSVPILNTPQRLYKDNLTEYLEFSLKRENLKSQKCFSPKNLLFSMVILFVEFSVQTYFGTYECFSRTFVFTYLLRFFYAKLSTFKDRYLN